jgi:hypothetical protein
LYQKGAEAGSCVEIAGEPSPTLKARVDAVNRWVEFKVSKLLP